MTVTLCTPTVIMHLPVVHAEGNSSLMQAILKPRKAAIRTKNNKDKSTFTHWTGSKSGPGGGECRFLIQPGCKLPECTFIALFDEWWPVFPAVWHCLLPGLPGVYSYEEFWWGTVSYSNEKAKLAPSSGCLTDWQFNCNLYNLAILFISKPLLQWQSGRW